MKFMSVREFRVSTGKVRKDLEREQEVVITANGQPFALLSRLHPETFDRELAEIRRARAKVALERVRESARDAGTAHLSMKEVDEIIGAVRKRKSNA